jgi:hypothetical protein
MLDLSVLVVEDHDLQQEMIVEMVRRVNPRGRLLGRGLSTGAGRGDPLVG